MKVNAISRNAISRRQTLTAMFSGCMAIVMMLTMFLGLAGLSASARAWDYDREWQEGDPSIFQGRVTINQAADVILNNMGIKYKPTGEPYIKAFPAAGDFNQVGGVSKGGLWIDGKPVMYYYYWLGFSSLEDAAAVREFAPEDFEWTTDRPDLYTITTMHDSNVKEVDPWFNETMFALVQFKDLSTVQSGRIYCSIKGCPVDNIGSDISHYLPGLNPVATTTANHNTTATTFTTSSTTSTTFTTSATTSTTFTTTATTTETTTSTTLTTVPTEESTTSTTETATAPSTTVTTQSSTTESTTTTLPPQPDGAPLPKDADLNGDGIIGAADTRLLYQYVSGNEQLSPEQLALADFYETGAPNMQCALLLFQYTAGQWTDPVH